LRSHFFLAACAGLTAASSFVAPAVRAGPVDPKVCIEATDQGQQLRDTGKLRQARAAFATCAQEGCPPPIRHDCQGWLDDVDQRMPTIVLGARAHGRDIGDVSVTLDGQALVGSLDGRPVAVDPGSHQLHFEHAGDPPVDQPVVVRTGEKDRLVTVTFGPEPAPPLPAGRPGPPTLAYVLAGVGGAGVVAFGILAGLGYSAYSQCKSEESSCNVSQERSKANDFWIPGDISLAVGLVAGGVATLLFLKPRSASIPAATAGIAPLRGGAMAQAGITF
jgi:hypothetical protein